MAHTQTAARTAQMRVLEDRLGKIADTARRVEGPLSRPLAMRLELAQNELNEHERLAAKNREDGKPVPSGKLFVSVARGLKTRGRAGLRFSDAGRAEVKVEDITDEELLKRQASGEYVVNPHGAEQILADDSLLVYTGPGPADNEQAAAQADELAKENDRLRAELARLQGGGTAAPHDTTRVERPRRTKGEGE